MTSRRTYQGAQPLLEIRRDETLGACLNKPQPYDVLTDATWGPKYDEALREARAMCLSCPIAASCLRENRSEPWAVAVLGRSKAEPTRQANCGTRGGYSKHRRAGETPCDDCKKAEAARWQQRSRKKNPDEATILRRMAGEQVRVTGAEASEVVRRMFLGGMSMAEIRKITRLKPERYWRASELGVVA